MPRNWFGVLAIALLLLTACGSDKQEPMRPDALAGTWSGEWGPSAQERNTVILELKWDGANLTGTVDPGPDAVELARVSFDNATNMVTMEADVKGRTGEMIHYTIEGKVEGNTMTGSWGHEKRKGDFYDHPELAAPYCRGGLLSCEKIQNALAEK